MAAHLAGAQMMLPHVRGDAEQPGLEAGLAAEARQRRDGLEENRLDQIFEIGHRPDQPPQHALHLGRMCPEELFDRLRIAGAAARQRLLARLVGALGKRRHRYLYIVPLAIRLLKLPVS